MNVLAENNRGQKIIEPGAAGSDVPKYQVPLGSRESAFGQTKGHKTRAPSQRNVPKVTARLSEMVVTSATRAPGHFIGAATVRQECLTPRFGGGTTPLLGRAGIPARGLCATAANPVRQECLPPRLFCYVPGGGLAHSSTSTSAASSAK